LLFHAIAFIFVIIITFIALVKRVPATAFEIGKEDDTRVSTVPRPQRPARAEEP
jgi:hypothetical protein